MNHSKAFTLIELLVVIAIIGLLASIVLVSLQGAAASARDGKRDAEAGESSSALRKTLEVYHAANGAYPWNDLSEAEDGCCLENNSDIKGVLAEYLSDELKDPLYDPDEPDTLDRRCYRYKTTNSGEDYKVRVNYETGGYKEVASWGGGGIVYEEEGLHAAILTGQTADDRFGVSVAFAGDVNNDGYPDVIVGARLEDTAASNAGAAYIYYGGSSIDTTADVFLTGEAADDYFGWYNISSAGDVNNDGFDDVIVGACRNDTAGSNAGRAYIYYGGSSMDSIADVILTGEAAGDYFGYSLASAGDVNDDGFDDVIVGAWSNDTAALGAGAAYIYYGGSSMDSTADVVFIGKAGYDCFGWDVASAGDVNNDSYPDVIVGARLDDTGVPSAGAAYIYYGGLGMDATADIILTGEAASDNFGESVAFAGDINDDGFDDVIVGAWSNDNAGSNAGRAYIYYGGSSMDSTADVIFTGEAADDNFGGNVASVSDVNNDGNPDVIIGALGNDTGGSDFGAAYIYYGGLGMDATADITLTGEASGDRFGESVAFAGDVNNDGNSDVIIGALGNDAGGIDAGRAYIFQGSDFNW